jgi:hypothetical protein
MALRSASLGDDNLNEAREFRFEALPNPDSNIFAGGVFEAGDFVEIMVIKLIEDGLASIANVGVVHDPAHFGVALSFDDDFGAEAMAMQAAALMIGRDMREHVGGLEVEYFSELEFH